MTMRNQRYSYKQQLRIDEDLKVFTEQVAGIKKLNKFAVKQKCQEDRLLIEQTEHLQLELNDRNAIKQELAYQAFKEYFKNKNHPLLGGKTKTQKQHLEFVKTLYQKKEKTEQKLQVQRERKEDVYTYLTYITDKTQALALKAQKRGMPNNEPCRKSQIKIEKNPLKRDIHQFDHNEDKAGFNCLTPDRASNRNHRQNSPNVTEFDKDSKAKRMFQIQQMAKGLQARSSDNLKRTGERDISTVKKTWLQQQYEDDFRKTNELDLQAFKRQCSKGRKVSSPFFREDISLQKTKRLERTCNSPQKQLTTKQRQEVDEITSFYEHQIKTLKKKQRQGPKKLGDILEGSNRLYMDAVHKNERMEDRREDQLDQMFKPKLYYKHSNMNWHPQTVGLQEKKERQNRSYSPFKKQLKVNKIPVRTHDRKHIVSVLMAPQD